MVTPMDTFNFMKSNFNQEACSAFTKPISFEYDIAGENGGVWHFYLDGKGNYELKEGHADRAAVTYKFVDAKSFDQLVHGEIDGLQAYTQGLVQVKGPIGLAEKYDKVFKGR